MINKPFRVIDPVATGANIVRLRKERGLTVRDLQTYFGFEEPQAIYKWQRGQSLPTIDNLYALGALFEVPMEEILVQSSSKVNILASSRSREPAARVFWGGAIFSDWRYDGSPRLLRPFAALFGALLAAARQQPACA